MNRRSRNIISIVCACAFNLVGWSMADDMPGRMGKIEWVEFFGLSASVHHGYSNNFMFDLNWRVVVSLKNSWSLVSLGFDLYAFFRKPIENLIRKCFLSLRSSMLESMSSTEKCLRLPSITFYCPKREMKKRKDVISKVSVLNNWMPRMLYELEEEKIEISW